MVRKIVFISSFVFFINGCNSITSEKDNYFPGVWDAYGYSCEGISSPSEKIEVIQKNDSIYAAIKRKGNNCMGAGDTTWIYNSSKQETIVKAILWDGSYEYFDAQMEVINKDSFNIILKDHHMFQYSRTNR